MAYSPIVEEDEAKEPEEKTMMDHALRGMSDQQLLGLLEKVSDEVKRRNSLMPKTSGSAMIDILKAIGEVARAGGHG